MRSRSRYLANAVMTLVNSTGLRASPADRELDIYSVTADDLIASKRFVHRLEQDWRRAGGLRVSEEQLDHLQQVKEARQAEHEQAVARCRLGLRLRHLRLVHRFVRTGIPRFGQGGVLGTAAAALCAVSLVLSPLFFGSLAGALVGATLFSAVTSGMLVGTALLLWPTEERRLAFLHLERQHRLALDRADATQAALAEAADDYERGRQCRILVDRLEAATRRRDELAALLGSVKYELIHSPWRNLRGVAFEKFLQRVFEMLGYQVQATKASGDQGVDLVVRGKGKVIAVQAKGHANSVNNHGVMEVTAGMRLYGCTASAVITNSSFTRSARQLAHANGCQLVDGSQIPDLIEGRIF